jgi:hypothetical protein
MDKAVLHKLAEVLATAYMEMMPFDRRPRIRRTRVKPNYQALQRYILEDEVERSLDPRFLTEEDYTDYPEYEEPWTKEDDGSDLIARYGM